MNEILHTTILGMKRGVDVSAANAEAVLDAILASEDRKILVDLLTAWNHKGITEDEIYGFARILRDRCRRVNGHEDSVDIVGTGGGSQKPFNVSTAAAIVTSAAGLKVAKHGNRAATSRSGAIDVLSKLNLEPSLGPGSAEMNLRRHGLAFLFAPAFHRLSAKLADARRSLPFPTIFNCIGPLANPANAQFQVIGTWSGDLVPKIANALHRLGTTRSLVVNGSNGLDEISISGTTIAAEVTPDGVRNYELAADSFGLEESKVSLPKAESVAESADRIRSVLNGERGIARDMVIANSAAAIFIAGRAASLLEGATIAADAIDSGKATEKLDILSAEVALAA
ncbi:MAG: anthranilate phosphoribosyltransferase [Acidobacteria bacterium ACB1]|nr:Anthranilate phosphoribosyltransferase [Pyrinomonadaceae bacterium]MCE7962434.1 anthranilate phosphoribosyltransferase [Acidobacteria bacterium ACB1]RIJ94029.1 MAG: anthranilate phosphoribosyltransferase [Acidobacteriota bacterium]